MSEQDLDGIAEDDGVLEPADTLESDDLRGDVLDTGIDAGEGYRGATRFGTTAEEERSGESLDQLLAEEEPDVGPDAPWTDEETPSDDDRAWEPRSGRLVAPDDGARPRGRRGGRLRARCRRRWWRGERGGGRRTPDRRAAVQLTGRGSGQAYGVAGRSEVPREG